MTFSNVYQDTERARAYAELQFANTYYLAFRDLPDLIRRHVRGKRALDFGCGTGRSARFLKALGFDVTGVDIAEDMLRNARQADPEGDYRLLADGEVGPPGGCFDLVLSAFTFDNIPADRKAALFSRLEKQLAKSGVLLNVVSSPEIYLHEWASFTTKDFPENRRARDGDLVQIITTDISDRRPCTDVLCGDASYRHLYAGAGLEVLETLRPLATGNEPYAWVSETDVAPWVVWALRSAGSD